MNKFLIAALLFATTATVASAQTVIAGAMLGGSEKHDSGLNLHLHNTTKEIFIGTEMEPTTIFGLKAGQIDSDDGPRVGAPGVTDHGKIEYIDAIVEYRFSEVFGSTGLFGGPGFYRQRFGSLEENSYGFTAGVNGLFPVTRHFGLTAEIAYHWTNFSTPYRFIAATGGVRVGF